MKFGLLFLIFFTVLIKAGDYGAIDLFECPPIIDKSKPQFWAQPAVCDPKDSDNITCRYFATTAISQFDLKYPNQIVFRFDKNALPPILPPQSLSSGVERWPILEVDNEEQLTKGLEWLCSYLKIKVENEKYELSDASSFVNDKFLFVINASSPKEKVGILNQLKNFGEKMHNAACIYRDNIKKTGYKYNYQPRPMSNITSCAGLLNEREEKEILRVKLRQIMLRRFMIAAVLLPLTLYLINRYISSSTLLLGILGGVGVIDLLWKMFWIYQI
jgi:hypothetical protein